VDVHLAGVNLTVTLPFYLRDKMPKGFQGFQKGLIPWSKEGLKGKSVSPATEFKKGHIPWHKGKHIYLGGGFKKGLAPWNKGKKGLQMSWNKGTKGIMKAWNKGKKCPWITGENSHFWKGGITSLHDIIRLSLENKQWIKKVFQRDKYTCQDCFKKSEGDLEAHHKKPFKVILREFLIQYSQFSPLEDKETLARLAITYEPFWDLTNGKTLCKDCHKIQKGSEVN